jgi:hypothetical protein
MKNRAKVIILMSAHAGVARLAAQVASEGFVVDTQVPFSGHPLGNIGAMPETESRYCCSDPRFNEQPEKSTFTPKINRSTKRW